MLRSGNTVLLVGHRSSDEKTFPTYAKHSGMSSEYSAKRKSVLVAWRGVVAGGLFYYLLVETGVAYHKVKIDVHL